MEYYYYDDTETPLTLIQRFKGFLDMYIGQMIAYSVNGNSQKAQEAYIHAKYWTSRYNECLEKWKKGEIVGLTESDLTGRLDED